MRTMRDYNLSKTLELPAGSYAGTVAEGDPIDLGDSTGEFLANHELRLILPALTAAELPNGNIMSVRVEDADDEAFTENVRNVFGNIIEVTGVTSTGTAQVERRMVLPHDVKRYIRPVVETDAESGDPSAKDLTYELLF